MTYSRRDQRRPMGTTSRRGAITVMVGLMMVGLMMISAIAVDASRAMAARNELQTAADAAALAAAIQLLGTSVASQDSAVSVASDFARRNYVVGTAVDSLRVVMGVWRPDTRTFIAGGGPRDAIEVSVFQRVNFLFASLLGSERIMLRATATAWSAAPVTASRCIKPWAIPYNQLTRVLDRTNRNETRDLTGEDIRRLREMSVREREFTLDFGRGASRDTADTDWTDEYHGVDLPARYRAADGSYQDIPADPSRRDYRRNIYDCNDSFVAAGDSVRAQPGRRRGSTVQAVIGPREYFGWDDDENDNGDGNVADPRALCSSYNGHHCFNARGEVGVPVKALFFSVPPGWTGCTSQCNLGVQMVGSFVLTSIVNRRGHTTHGQIAGYFSLARDHEGVLGGEESTMLHRPVLVR